MVCDAQKGMHADIQYPESTGVGAGSDTKKLLGKVGTMIAKTLCMYAEAVRQEWLPGSCWGIGFAARKSNRDKNCSTVAYTTFSVLASV